MVDTAKWIIYTFFWSFMTAGCSSIIMCWLRMTVDEPSWTLASIGPSWKPSVGGLSQAISVPYRPPAYVTTQYVYQEFVLTIYISITAANAFAIQIKAYGKDNAYCPFLYTWRYMLIHRPVLCPLGRSWPWKMKPIIVLYVICRLNRCLYYFHLISDRCVTVCSLYT